MSAIAPIESTRPPLGGELSLVPTPLAWLAVATAVLLLAGAIALSGRPLVALVLAAGFLALGLVNAADRLLGRFRR